MDSVSAVTLQQARGSLPARPERSASDATGFEQALQTAQAGQSAGPYVVKRGDNLWRICSEALRTDAARPSRHAVSEAVARVAEANRMQNPDLLRIGQELDLSILHPAPPAPAPILSEAPATDAPEPAANASLLGMGGVGAAMSPGVAYLELLRERVNDTQTRLAETLQRNLNAATGAVKAASSGGAALARRVTDSVATASAPAAPAGMNRPDLNELLETLLTSKPQAVVANLSPWGQLLSGRGILSSSFGMRADPFTGRWQHHDGLDIAAEPGTRIHAVAPGTVEFSGWLNGYGRAVIVKHADGSETLYGHNSKNAVAAGDAVDTATVLGYVGSSGRSTGPHLHFEVRKNGHAVDPMPVLKQKSLQIAQAF